MTFLTLYSDKVLAITDQYNIPRPIGNRPIFDNWFLQLHEIAHHLVLPKALRQWASTLQHEPFVTDKPCAPMVPDSYLIHNDYPDENGARLLCLDLIESHGWINPYLLYPELFGGSGFNIKQWFLTKAEVKKARTNLESWGINVKYNRLENIDELTLPALGTDWLSILANHDYIYQRHGWRSVNEYDAIFLKFLRTSFPSSQMP